MSFSATLSDVLIDGVLTKASADGNITLEERAARMKVAILNSPPSAASICLGKFNHLSVIQGGRYTGRLKKCDYLLITEKSGLVSVVFIELKKTLSDGAHEQLRRSLPFLDYLCSVCSVEAQADFRESIDSIDYFIIAEKYNDRFDKQRVKVPPQRRIWRESYKDITVNAFVGSSISHAALAGV